MKPIKRSIKRPLSLARETVRHLAAGDLRRLGGGNDVPTHSAYQCGTLVSCAACTDLPCIMNTSVITSCR